MGTKATCRLCLAAAVCVDALARAPSPLVWEDRWVSSDHPESTRAPAKHITFLHGHGGSPLTWENQVAKLPPQGVRAQAPWLRGLRPAAKERFDIGAASGDLLMSLQLEGAPATAIVGHSIGAMVGLQMALDAPESVSHLVLVSGQVRPPATVMRAQKLALKLTPRSRFEKLGISKNRVRQALDVIAEFDASDRLGDVSVPTLVMVGESDRATSDSAYVLADGIADAELFVVPGAGASPMTENVPTFNERLWRFLGVEPHDY